MHDRAARADYSAAARYLWRREFAGWGSVRVLSPPESRPHLVAAVALLRYTDDLSDSGPVEGRAQRFDEWAAHVAAGLDTGSSGHRLLRPYLHSVALLNLSRTWIDAYLAGTRIDLDFPGFAEEADYQRYIDTVSLPSFMLGPEAMPGLATDQNFISLARSLVDGGQRADFLTDMFEDLRDGRLCLPVSDLDRYGVSRADLEQGRDTPGVRALISATASSARASLVASEQILGEIAPEFRPFFRFLIDLFHERLDDVEARGAAVFRRPYHDAVVRSMALVARCRRMGASTNNTRPGHPELDGAALRPS
ncbi:squalene/phytoene synthase family protein [Nocardia sp. 2YAB30]|uniref:squalene/phytoene synthase family protein n=1 Tax=unclassified Nocardia TaxID=2637762 RepID=UPI003F974AA8